MEAKMISKLRLTTECWWVQLAGLNQCKTCEVKDTPNCVGQKIRQTGKNEKGFSVPID